MIKEFARGVDYVQVADLWRSVLAQRTWKKSRRDLKHEVARDYRKEPDKELWRRGYPVLRWPESQAVSAATSTCTANQWIE